MPVQKVARRWFWNQLFGSLLATVVAFALAEAPSAQVADGQKRVLVLYATGRDSQIAITGERQLPRILDEQLGSAVDYYAEYFDGGRFPDHQFEDAFIEFLRLKYHGRRFDAVIAMQDRSLEFLAKHRDQIFPGAPVVFASYSPVTVSLAHSTGVISEVDLAQTLALATALQPEIRQVFVVNGTAVPDKDYEAQARAQFRRFEPRLEFTYLSGLPTKVLLQRLAALPPQSIVYYLLVYQDGTGASFQPLEYLDRLVAVANRPIYSWVDSTIGRGVVGGHVRRQQSQVDAVARLTVRVLRGERPDSIPVSTLDLAADEVDWRQLQRWGISERRLPAGTVVLFREPGAWERYQWQIIGGVAFTLVQSALVVGLIANQIKRRRAERSVRESERRFRLLSDAAPVMIWLAGQDKLCIDINRAWLAFTGRSIEAELGNGWLDRVHPDDLSRRLETYGGAFDRRESFRMEYRLRRHDGEYRWVLDTGVPRFAPDGSFSGYVGSALDITELKLARAALSNLSRRLMEAHEQERAWLARELQEDLCQRIMALTMRLHGVSEAPDHRAHEMHAQIEDVCRQFSELASDIQTISYQLHSSKLELLGLSTTAATFCQELSARHNMTIDFSDGGVPDDLPEDIALGLFRVLQEALGNVVKHSGVSQCRVTLRGCRDHVELEVADDGLGFDPDAALARHGLGLTSMRERVALINGEFSLTSRPGAGARIHVRVPLRSSVPS